MALLLSLTDSLVPVPRSAYAFVASSSPSASVTLASLTNCSMKLITPPEGSSFSNSFRPGGGGGPAGTRW